jgi:hypothetical protein
MTRRCGAGRESGSLGASPPRALVTQIRDRLARYLSAEITLHDFRQWLTAQAWNIDHRADAETADLVHEIELVLAEYDHGDWTKDEVISQLAPLVQHIQLSSAGFIQTWSTGSALGIRAANATRNIWPTPPVATTRIEHRQQRVA